MWLRWIIGGRVLGFGIFGTVGIWVLNGILRWWIEGDWMTIAIFFHLLEEYFEVRGPRFQELRTKSCI